MEAMVMPITAMKTWGEMLAVKAEEIVSAQMTNPVRTKPVAKTGTKVAATEIHWGMLVVQAILAMQALLALRLMLVVVAMMVAMTTRTMGSCRTKERRVISSSPVSEQLSLTASLSCHGCLLCRPCYCRCRRRESRRRRSRRGSWRTSCYNSHSLATPMAAAAMVGGWSNIRYRQHWEATRDVNFLQNG
jgi:hypothetical protein